MCNRYRLAESCTENIGALRATTRQAAETRTGGYRRTVDQLRLTREFLRMSCSSSPVTFGAETRTPLTSRPPSSAGADVPIGRN